MSSSSGSSPDSLRVGLVPAQRHHELIEHLRNNFFADEPLNHAVQLCRRGEAHVELERHCILTLEQDLSYMVIDENDKIVGAALNGVVRRNERDECKRRLEELQDQRFKSIFGLLYRLNERLDLFDKYGADELFECRILSVAEEQRGRGLAHMLLENSVALARRAGFKVMKADATGIFSQKVFLKHDFKVVTEIQYSEVEESLRPGAPHEALKLMVKVLN